MSGSIRDRNDETRKAFMHIKARYVFAIMGFFGQTVFFSMRLNLSVAMVAMVNSTAVSSTDESESGDSAECAVATSSMSSRTDGPFDWNSQIQGLLLGAWFVGYTITQIPGGGLAARFGGKVMYITGIVVISVFTLLSPVAANTSYVLFVLCRCLEGLGGGFLFPSMHTMIGKWSPPNERSTMASFIYSGGQLGTIVGLILTGVLCNSDFIGGWPSAFYVFGAMSLFWCILALFLVYESPATHPRISEEERNYILKTLGNSVKRKTPPVPWKSICSSVPVWSIVVAQFGNSWMFFTLITELPTYMSDIYNVDVTTSSVVSAVPFVASWICSYFFGWIADTLRKRKYLSVTTIRKIFQAISQIGPIISLFCLAYMGCNYWASVGVLIFGLGLNGALFSGYFSNPIDLAPNFAGPLLGLTGCIANLSGIIAPLVVGYLTNGQQTLTQWKIVFLIAAGINIVTDVFYLIFASSEEQTWNNPVTEKDAETKETGEIAVHM